MDTAPTVVDFQNILDLMGEKDAEVVSVLGEGYSVENDDSTILNREYTLSLFDEDATVITIPISITKVLMGETGAVHNQPFQKRTGRL